MANIRDLSKIPAENISRFPENMLRQALNDNLRALEASLRQTMEEMPWFEFSDSTVYTDADTFTVTGEDHTTLILVGDRVRAVGSTTGDIQGEVTQIQLDSGNTVVDVTWDSGQLESETLNVYLNIGGGGEPEKIVSQQVSYADTLPAVQTHQITPQNDNIMFVVDATDGPIDLETPTLTADDNGFYFRFKRTSSSAHEFRITTPGSETIDDGVNWVVPQQYASGTIAWDGTEWWIVTLGRNGLSTGEVVTPKLADAAVTGAKIADDAVALNHLAHGTGNKVVGFAADGTPTEVNNGAGSPALKIAEFNRSGHAATGENQVFSTVSNEIWAMGSGGDKANGAHGSNSRELPNKISGFPSDKAVLKIVSGYRCHYVLTTDGKVYVWGRNSDGQLGLGDTTSRATMEQITALDGVVVTDIAVAKAGAALEICAFFLTSTGTVWSCGADAYGQLGQGASPADNTTATLIAGLTDVSKIAVSGDRYPSVMTVQNDGTMMAWGYNGTGNLGIGNTTNQNTPQPVPSVTDVQDVVTSSGFDGATAGSFSLCLKTDGTVLATGDNKTGQLGQGDTTDLSVFTSVSFSPAATISKIEVGGGSSGLSAALDDNGNMWSWGFNAHGQHGLGTTATQTSPQKLSESWQGNLVDVKVVGSLFYLGIAVRTATQAWVAGYGQFYNLCIGDAFITNNTFNEILGIDGNISDFGCHGYSNIWGLSFLMADGRMLTGGYGATGQLGQGNFVNSGDLQPIKGFLQRAENAMPNDRGVWATATRYELGDVIEISGPPKTYYICISAHDSSAGDKPTTGASWATYWKFIGQESMHVGNDTVSNINTNFPAASHTGKTALITDEVGGAVLAFSDGTDWRRCTDRAVIST